MSLVASHGHMLYADFCCPRRILLSSLTDTNKMLRVNCKEDRNKYKSLTRQETQGFILYEAIPRALKRLLLIGLLLKK